MKEKFVALSVLEQLRKLDEERARLISTAKEEALARANAAIAELNELGFDYGLVNHEEQATPAKPKGASGQKREKDPNKPCSICNFLTDPNHDARSHRNQKPQKAFTAKELEEKGLIKRA